MNKAFRYRLDPHAEQEILIHKTLGCVRFVYNRMLANHQAIYDGCKNDKATKQHGSNRNICFLPISKKNAHGLKTWIVWLWPMSSEMCRRLIGTSSAIHP